MARMSDEERLARNRRRIREKRKERSEKGLCQQCARPMEPGDTHIKCAECREKAAEASRKSGMRKYYARKAAGICTACGMRVPRPGHTLCFECALAGSISHRKWYIRRKEAGQC